MEPIINSPFKFLDPYGKEDYKIFFGRDEEIDRLYQYIHKNRLVLVYGTSGTGKTSIVQCGLMNRMDDLDWKPFFIRRGDNLNDSLLNNLKKSVNEKAEIETGVSSTLSGKGVLVKAPAPRPANVVKISNICDQVYDHLKSVNLKYLRSVYLIFDQFEELLILGSEAEKKTFIEIIDHILCDPELQFCSLLFIMREEFFAGLNDFEKEIPDFCDRRLRIEPMNARNVEEVITKSCVQFDIKLQEGAENAQQIISVLMEKGVVSLPYLQIYLDQLWRSVYMITPVKTVPPGKTFPVLTFNNAIIKRFGGMQEVLERFIRERITVIQDLLEKEFPGIPEDFVSNVLDAFVTSEGTKRPIAYMRVNEGIWFTGQVPPYLQKRPGNLMIRCLSEMEKNKILRMEGLTYELAHDVLAGLIDNRRTEEQRRAGLTDQQIRSRFTGYQKSISELLSEKEIESYKPYIDQLNLPQEIIAFYEASILQRDTIAKQRKQEAEKLQKLKDRQRRWKWGWVLGGILLLASTGLYLYSQMLRKEFNRNESLVFMGYDMKDLDPVVALNLFGPIKEKVYGEDTNKVNRKLLEFMQTQDIQGKFARYNKELPVSLVEPGKIDISEDGDYIVLEVTTDRQPGSKLGDYSVYNNEGKSIYDDYGRKISDFSRISYVYFTNRPNILLLAYNAEERKRLPSGGRNQNERLRKGERARSKGNTEETGEAGNTNDNNNDQPYQTESPLPNEFLLFDCVKRTAEVIKLGGPRRYLNPIEDLADGPFREFDSYRVRFADNGNLIVPYIELDERGFLTRKAQLLDGKGNFVAVLESSNTVTTNRDFTRILTIDESQDYRVFMNVYNTRGERLMQIEDVRFGDFTEDGRLLWGYGEDVNLANGRDTIRFTANPSSYSPYDYAYGSMERKKLIVRRDYDYKVELIDMHDNSRRDFDGELIAANFNKRTFIVLNRFSASRGVGPLDTLVSIYFRESYMPWYKVPGMYDVPVDTLRRRDLNGRLTAPAYTHPDGFATVQYNRRKDEILILTKQNKLIVLDKDMKEKTAMQLTANDRYGISANGEVLYYVRDKWLSVFPNNIRLHAFDASRIWEQLQQPPLKMDMPKQRVKELGLTFK